MIIDSTLLFSDGQAITADAASTSIVDLGATGTPYGHLGALIRDVGKGQAIPLLITVTETFNNLTSMQILIQTDDNSSFSSATTVAETPAIPQASLVAGYQVPFPNVIAEGVKERYVRIYYDITGAAPSTGKVTATVVAARQTNRR